MKALIIFLLLTSVLWADGPFCFRPLRDGSGMEAYDCYKEELLVFHPYKYDVRLTEKGHCPHCGAKGDLMDFVRFSTGNYSYKVLFCPNGHIFNERD